MADYKKRFIIIIIIITVITSHGRLTILAFLFAFHAIVVGGGSTTITLIHDQTKVTIILTSLNRVVVPAKQE